MTDSMRIDTQRMIADNPSSITITRKTYAITKGARVPSTTTLSAQTVRFYEKKGPLNILADGERVRAIRTREIKMLCLHDANVNPHSETNEDTFISGTTTYRIVQVRPVTWEGLIISKQCLLEEVAH